MLRLSFCRVEVLLDLRTSCTCLLHEAKLVLDVVFSLGYNRFRREKDWKIQNISKCIRLNVVKEVG